jgi:hypothetical protein
MASKNRPIKSVLLPIAKVKLPQKALHAKTETEAIELALDFVIAEHKANRLANDANQRFLTSGIQIKDVYGRLSD